MSVPVRARVAGTLEARITEVGGRAAVLVFTGGGRRTSGIGAPGALGAEDGPTLAAAAQLALSSRLPLVVMIATSGHDVGDGVAALHSWGQAAREIARCSGIVPILMGVTGPVVAGPALLLGLADVVVMSSNAYAFVSGPSMVAEFTGVEIGLSNLGGTDVHARLTGVASIVAEDAEEVQEKIGAVLGYLPSHADEEPPGLPVGDPGDREVPELEGLVPRSPTGSYDVRDAARAISDDGALLELRARFAPQLVTALARVEGRPVGIVANQPRSLAGTLDIAASQKGARFVDLCDSFNLPLITLVDTGGFLPGKDLEWRGMIRHGAQLAFSYARATVPRVCVILRKAYGGAYIVMDSRGIGNDVCFAWPSAELAVMGAEQAVQVLHRRANPEERAFWIEEHRSRQVPWTAAERGLVDAVILPRETRAALSGALRALATKRERLPRRKHDNTPL